jgi:aminoglycoside 3-N-acetyltransferase
MGIAPNDTLLVHANFRVDSGFRGTPHDLVSALVDFVGQRGNLMMVSQPFRGYAYDYLQQGKPFQVTKTASMMGLVTEMFRRRSGTLRSLHPTHPVLAYGRDAAAIVAGHGACLFPCGSGTPFAKFREMNGKILFFDVGSGANTFFHHVEDLRKDRLPFPLYAERLFAIPAIDAEGRRRVVETYAFEKGVIRHTDRLEVELARQGKLVRRRVGNSKLLLVNAGDVVDVMTQMIEAGQGLIELPAR